MIYLSNQPPPGATKGKPMNDAHDTDSTAGTISPKELANELGTDPKTVRKFLRSLSADRPGKGGRWAIPTDMVEELTDRFSTWSTNQATVFSIDEVDEGDED